MARVRTSRSPAAFNNYLCDTLLTSVPLCGLKHLFERRIALNMRAANDYGVAFSYNVSNKSGFTAGDLEGPITVLPSCSRIRTPLGIAERTRAERALGGTATACYRILGGHLAHGHFRWLKTPILR
jgi:hypothetical protein